MSFGCLPVVNIVIAFSASVIDMSLLLAPSTPSTLSIRALKAYQSAEFDSIFIASNLALIQLLVIIVLMVCWVFLEKIVQQSYKRWDVTGVTIIHRVGKLLPSDQIVFVGVSSKHRQNAFDSCNFIMDWLKTKAPFWKVEENDHQKKWVDYNLSDDEATKKWSL